MGPLPSRCTVLHGDAGVDADFLEPFSRCTCIAGWIVLNGRLDHIIVPVVGSDCIGGWTVQYNVSAVGSYQSDRSFIHFVSAVGFYRIGGWAMLYRRLDHTVSAVRNCIGGWIILYRQLDCAISAVG